MPHRKGQDNFGGLLTSDKLKSFATIDEGRGDDNNYDDDFDGELMTIKGNRFQDFELEDQTLRPRKADYGAGSPSYSHRRNKSSLSRPGGGLGGNLSQQHRSPPKAPYSKFELPSRPDVFYREQSIEDYSDLFVDNDSVFDRNPNQAVKKVSYVTFSDVPNPNPR